MQSALLVIDVQQCLFDEAPRPFEAGLVIDRINALTARARKSGTPVIFIQHERNDGPLRFGGDGWQLAARLIAEAGDTFVRKTTPDSFLRTDLADILTHLSIEQVVICGYASEFCVDTTVRRAAALGYRVVLAADAHTTHDKSHASGQEIRTHHNATLPEITSFGPQIKAIPAKAVSFAP